MEMASESAAIYTVPIREDCPSLGFSLAEVVGRQSMRLPVVYIKRGERGFITKGEDRLLEGNTPCCICYKNKVQHLAGVLWPAGGPS